MRRPAASSGTKRCLTIADAPIRLHAELDRVAPYFDEKAQKVVWVKDLASTQGPRRLAEYPGNPVQLAGGYAHMFSGAFLEQATPGKSYSIYSSNMVGKAPHYQTGTPDAGGYYATASYLATNGATCPDCHGHDNTINAGWAEGGHGSLTAAPWVSNSSHIWLDQGPSANGVNFQTSPNQTNCIRCHTGATPPKKIDLTGDKTDYFNVSYEWLARGRKGNDFVNWDSPYVNWIPTYNGQEWNILEVHPKTWGSPQSKLAEVVLSGHPDEKGKPRFAMDETSRRRILSWIDLNVPYYGTSETAYPERPGCRQIVPEGLESVLADVGKRRCAECHAQQKTHHDSAAGTVSECTNCHTPHGSANRRLLAAAMPFLCIQCHNPGHRNTLNQVTKPLYANRCTDCHSTIHGSDTPDNRGYGTLRK